MVTIGVCIFRCVLLLGTHFFILGLLSVIALVNLAQFTRAIMKNYRKEENKNEIIVSFIINIFNGWIMAYCIIGKISDKKIKERALMIDNKKIGERIENVTADMGNKTKTLVTNSKDKVTAVIDVNGDGKIDIEDIIVLGLKTPGIKINRSDFLLKEFEKHYDKSIIATAIEHTPTTAGIDIENLNRIADDVIKFEQRCVTSISVGLGIPGGVAMAATISADIVQYYGYMLRTAQKLMYLYGFPEINIDENGQNFDSETLNILILCLGAMYGVVGANHALKAMAKALAVGVEKKLMRTALTKGTIYPIVKSVSKWFGVRMTKEIFSGFFKKAIPVVGGIVGGGITYMSFKPCCEKLKGALQDTFLTNPNHTEVDDENIIVIEVELKKED